MDSNAKQPQQQPTRQPLPSAPQPTGTVGGKKESPTGVAPREWVGASTPEIVLPKEVKDVGVETVPHIPNVSQQAQQAGVQHAKEATPVETVKAEPLGMKTPRSVLDHMKAVHKSVADGVSWLVRLVIKEQDKKEKGGVL